MRLLKCLFLLGLSLGCAPIAPAVAPADAQARFLAGLSVEATELEPLARDPAWQEHASSFHRAWLDLEERQLAPIRVWMPAMAGQVHRDPSPLFYLFSGPDFLYAHAFFPQASTYILCGREPVGDLPDVAMLSQESRAHALRNLRTALNSILSFSFFITQDMKSDLTQTQLSGTLPVLYVFLARTGCQIQSAELVKLDDRGSLTSGKSKTPGVRLRFIGPSGRPQTLYYFTTDLSNWGIQSNPGFLAFCRQQGQGNGFTKAASYLMHQDGFDRARDFLLQNTRHLLQDDSGVPYRFFTADRWMVQLFGAYPGPIELFKEHAQPDLDAAFRSIQAPELPFGVGYQWRPGMSSLLLGTALSRVPRAIPLEE